MTGGGPGKTSYQLSAVSYQPSKEIYVFNYEKS
jgi:hypothetical protein